MNEFGAVLAYKIVPNDTKEYLQELLTSIWSVNNNPTKAMYTDHPSKDSKTIINTWNSIYKFKFPNQSIIVLQDIFHAQNRVLKGMSKNHSDYKFSSQEIKQIIYKVKTGYYEKKEDFKEKLKKWQKKWNQTKQNGYKLSDFQFVIWLGKIFIFKILNI